MAESVGLEKLSAELLERLSKEEARPPSTPKTSLVGGVVTACRLLEALLRETVCTIADHDGRNPVDLLQSQSGRRTPIAKATAGALAHALRELPPSRSHPKVVAPILSDLRARNSAVLEFIRVRNLVAKQGEDAALLLTPTRDLRAWVIRFRKNSGWV